MSLLSSFFSLDRYTILARIAIMLLILPLHEFAHGWVAKKCGDDTASVSGRLTLNPIAHLDPFGSVLLLLTGFGWAKPVPINPARMRHPRTGVIWTSLAGPVSNLLAALVGVIGLQIVYPFYVLHGGAVLLALRYFFSVFATVNVSLAIFNLIPVPPLDGSKVLMMLLPYKQGRWIETHQQILSLILWALILFGVLSTPLSWLSSWVIQLFIWITNWISLLIQLVL
jgi:Zn-dependent protease